jgi:hypothetical protein
MLEQVMDEPLYDTLRTKEQLGYSVSCGVRMTNGLRPEDVSWTLESVDVPAALFSSAAADQRFKPGTGDGFPAGGEEPKSFAWSASNIAPYLETPDQLWRIKASVLADRNQRPRGAIVVGEAATSLRLGAGSRSLSRSPAPVAWKSPRPGTRRSSCLRASLDRGVHRARRRSRARGAASAAGPSPPPQQPRC